METCSWCGSFTDKLVENNGDMICEQCNSKFERSICRKCGETFSNTFMIKGLCLNCMQVEETKKSQLRDEAILGIDGGNSIANSWEFHMTEQDYDEWVTYGCDKHSPAELKKDRTLKRIWILVKLNASGIYDQEIIDEHMDTIEELLDENFTKLLKTKCKLMIINSMKDRRSLGDAECIAHKGKVYIVRHPEDC